MNQAERKRMAKEHVYANKGKGPCPYEKGTAEYSHWHRVQKHYWNMEESFDDMAAVYGEFRPDRMQS